MPRIREPEVFGVRLGWCGGNPRKKSWRRPSPLFGLFYLIFELTADEPVDVAEFRKRHAEFPHTSTANQFFDESHFESYRELGHHVAEGIFTSNMKPLPVKTSTDAADEVEKLFDKIKKRYHLLMATEDNQSARAHSA